jgi:hypothetical protein
LQRGAADVCLGPRPCSPSITSTRGALDELNATLTQASKTGLRQGPTPEPLSTSDMVPEPLSLTDWWCLVIVVQARLAWRVSLKVSRTCTVPPEAAENRSGSVSHMTPLSVPYAQSIVTRRCCLMASRACLRVCSGISRGRVSTENGLEMRILEIFIIVLRYVGMLM